MFLKALLVGLVAIYQRLDSRILGRLNGERPLISCTLVGLVLGDLQTGLAVGAQMELVSMGFISIGASGYNMNLGSVIACALVIINHLDTSAALAIAAITTTLYNALCQLRSVIVIAMNGRINTHIENGNFSRAKNIQLYDAAILQALFDFIPAFLCIYLGADAIAKLNEMIPAQILNGLTLGSNFVCFYGFATLLNIMYTKQNAIFFFLGFIIAAYAGLSLIQMASIGVIAAVILYQIRYNNPQAGGPVKDVLED